MRETDVVTGMEREREAVVGYLKKRAGYFIRVAEAADDEEERGAYYFAVTVIQNEIKKISSGKHHA